MLFETAWKWKGYVSLVHFIADLEQCQNFDNLCIVITIYSYGYTKAWIEWNTDNLKKFFFVSVVPDCVSLGTGKKY